MRRIPIAIAAALLCGAPAHADSYPLDGKWAYDGSSGAGPTDCDNHATVEFSGDRRFEAGHNVPPAYRNLSVEQESQDSYRIVDQFYNLMQGGKVEYTLRRLDPSHIEIQNEIGGATQVLRSCH